MTNSENTATRPPSLMPLPRWVGRTADRFFVGAGLRYSLAGEGGPAVAPAARRLVTWLRERVGIDIDGDPLAEGAAQLRFVCVEPGSVCPELAEDESYALQVSATGIDLVACRPVGVLRGFATLQQMCLDRWFAGESAGEEDPCPWLGGLVIDDRPRFPWRGLMIDVSRHFMPVAVLERQLDAMAFVKLNVLHLHLTDDQGFRVECRAFPELHGKGSGGAFYSRDEIRGLVRYALARGIRVVPEFDIPGHASSWLAGYPHLGCRPDDEYRVVETLHCVDVCMNPADEQVYAFLDAFFADVLPLFPDAFVHIGGDEVLGDEWRSTPDVVAFMREQGIADTAGLQAWFNVRLQQIVARHGKRMIGWDEIAHPSIATDAIVQSWRGPDSVADVTAQGYGCVRSHGYYLNALHAAEEHYVIDPAGGDLSAAQAARVLGGEACMWTEFVDADNIDSRIWPRTAAIAERFWSPGNRCDVGVLRERLRAVGAMLEVAGVRHAQDLRDHLAGLARGRSTAALATILGTLVPAPRDAVVPSRETDRQTVLRRLQDVIPVCSLAFAASLGRGVDYGDEAARGAVQTVVHGWVQACGRFEREFAGTSVLAELAPFLDRLRSSVDLVDEGLAVLRGEAPVDGDWVAASERCLEQMAAPHAGMQLAVLAPIGDLVGAVRAQGG